MISCAVTAPLCLHKQKASSPRDTAHFTIHVYNCGKIIKSKHLGYFKSHQSKWKQLHKISKTNPPVICNHFPLEAWESPLWGHTVPALWGHLWSQPCQKPPVKSQQVNANYHGNFRHGTNSQAMAALPGYTSSIPGPRRDQVSIDWCINCITCF